MHRLGPSKSSPDEWGPATGHYSRLTLGTSCKLRRPLGGYPPLRVGGSSMTFRLPPSRSYKTECLDLGFIDTQFELGKN